MKKNIKIPIDFFRQTVEGGTVITYAKDHQMFTIAIPLTDVIDWTKPNYREIMFDPDQEYRVMVADVSPAVKPMNGTVQGSVIENDLNRLVESGTK
jgi:hypothetical protein